MGNQYVNPTNFAETKRKAREFLGGTAVTRPNSQGVDTTYVQGMYGRTGKMTQGLGRRSAQVMDYANFMSHDTGNVAGAIKGFRGMSRAGQRGAMATAGALGGIARGTQFLSNNFELMGKKMTYGRAGVTAGLGMLALRNGANVVDRMRYGDYGGAMMSGALTAAAGYGAYSSYMYKGALRSHFNNAARFVLKQFR